MRLSMRAMTRMTILTVLFASVAVVGFAQEIQPGTLVHSRRLIVKFKATSKSFVRERSVNDQIRVARLERSDPIKPDGGTTPLPGGVGRKNVGPGKFIAAPEDATNQACLDRSCVRFLPHFIQSEISPVARNEKPVPIA
jgi:hypothetical protein